MKPAIAYFRNVRASVRRFVRLAGLIPMCQALLVAGSLLSGAATAACSPYATDIKFNEVQIPNSATNYIELRILNPAIVAASNNFSGWTVRVARKNLSTSAVETLLVNLNSVAVNTSQNTCGASSAWIQIPDSVIGDYLAVARHAYDLNFVLYDSDGNMVDLLRIAEGTMSSFYSGAGSQCSAIEPSPASTFSNLRDFNWGGGSSVKDWYRTPDGSGAWTGTTNANNSNSICGSNDVNAPAQVGLNKVASTTTVNTNTNFSFTLYAQNPNTGTNQSNVVVTDNLNTAGLTFVSCTATAPDTCSNSAGIVTWTISSLPINTIRSAVLTVKSTTTGTKTNIITATTSGTATATAVVTVTNSVPAITTVAATSVTGTGATLNGTVNPNGAATTVSFGYSGFTGNYATTCTPASNVFSGSTVQSFSCAVSGLACGKAYYFRATGANGGGTSNGAELSFTTPTCGPDHIELVHDGAGLTCTAKAVTVLGCNTATACNGVPGNQYTTGSFSVALTAIAGAQWCVDSDCVTTLASPATVTNGTVIYLRDTNVRTDRMAGTSASASTAALQCLNTATSAFNATTACDVVFGASGFLVSLPNHVSCATSTLTVNAVQSNNNATNCVPMFRNRTRAETISFAYSNPATGTLVPSVAGTPISTGGTSVNLDFDNNGIATPSFVYQDVGRLSITVTDPTLPLTGSTTTLPVIAPASFAFSGITAGPIGAGNAFSATLTARNSCAIPAATPNFGKETAAESATIAFGSRVAPTGVNDCVNGPCNGAVAGGVTLPWANGVATASNLSYSEVGQMTLAAALASGSYLGSGLTATGASGTVGAFVPAYFTTAVTHGCPAGSFTYSAQPFTATVTARNAIGGTTLNYSNLGACAVCSKLVTLSDPTATANFNGTNTIAATAFAAGIGSRNTVAYTLPIVTTAPATITLRAIDSTVTPNVSSAGYTEATTAVRSGRLRLSNAFGSEKSNLAMVVQTQYWSGQSWLLNSADSCTTLPASAFFLVGAPPGVTASNVTIAGGAGTLTLTKPSPTTTANVDVAANLGAAGSDQSCLATHGGTAANLPWLRSQNGNCAVTFDRDPSARASFGIYAPETKKTIHVREQF